MSRAAQEVQRQVQELKKTQAVQRPSRRAKMNGSGDDATKPDDEVAAGEDNRPIADATDQLLTGTDEVDPNAAATGTATTTAEGDSAMAKTKKKATKKAGAAKGAKKKVGGLRQAAKAAKPAKAARAPRESRPPLEKAPFVGMPHPADMRLARNGVSAGDGATVQIEFTNGYAVQLKPVGGGGTTEEVRDLMVQWLRKRLGADRG